MNAAPSASFGPMNRRDQIGIRPSRHLVASSDVLLLLLNSDTPRADAVEAEPDAPIQSMNSDVASPEAGSLPSMSLPIGGIVPPTDPHCAD